MDAADDAVLLEALRRWAPQDDSAPAEAVRKVSQILSIFD